METNVPQEAQPAYAPTPFADVLEGLYLHFVSLGRHPEKDMQLALTLAFPADWVVYETADVTLLDVQTAGNGCLVTLVGVTTQVPVDTLLAHAGQLVSHNQAIDNRRQEILRQQKETERRLQEEINALMASTGAVKLAPKLQPAPVAPVAPVEAPAAPRIGIVEDRPQRPQATQLGGRPDLVYLPPADMPVGGADVAPTVEELMRQAGR